MSKQFWGVIAAIVIVFIGIIALGGNKSDTKSSKSDSSNLTQNVTGKGTSGVTLVEYGDFQCPVCGEYHPIIKQVIEKYGDQIKFQFRNFPLTSVHQNAFAASRAAEAAALQNRYWDMNNTLFDTQSQWSNSSDPFPIFSQIAKQLGLNEAQFKKDYNSSVVNDRINADMAKGTELKITGTPTFFINGVQVKSAPRDIQGFSKLIDAEIAKQGASNTSTTPATKQQ